MCVCVYGLHAQRYGADNTLAHTAADVDVRPRVLLLLLLAHVCLVFNHLDDLHVEFRASWIEEVSRWALPASSLYNYISHTSSRRRKRKKEKMREL